MGAVFLMKACFGGEGVNHRPGVVFTFLPGLFIINECISLKVYTCESTLRGGAATRESLKSDFPTFGL